MHKQNRALYIIINIFVISIWLLPYTVLAIGSTPLGEKCSNDSDCATNDCEDSALDLPDDDFCVCNDSIDCVQKYGDQTTDPMGTSWACTDKDDDIYYNLHYCVDTKGDTEESNDEIKNPLTGNTDPEVKKAMEKFGTPGIIDVLTNSEGTVQKFQSEISQMMSKPQPKINIPGVNFSDIDIKKMISTDVQGNTWLNIPFLGEYISSIYKYAMVIVGVLSVIAIMDAGTVWLLRGSSSEGKQEAQKKLVMAITGLIITAVSYVLLYTINPNLVEFRSLQVLYIKNPNDLHDADSETFSDVLPPPCKKPNNPSAYAGFGVNGVGTLDEYACGTRDLSKVKYLVIHEGGRDGATVGILKKRGLSTHYVIKTDGTVTQVVGLEKRAYHAGAINGESIGVDLEAQPGCSASVKCTLNPTCLEKCFYSPAQYDALNKLIDFVSARTGIVRDDAHIIGHCQVSGTDHGDPRKFDWKLLGFDPCKHRKDCGESGYKACIKAWGPGNAYSDEPKDDSDPQGCCILDEEGKEVKAPKKRKDCYAMKNVKDFLEMSCPLDSSGGDAMSSEDGGGAFQ